MAKKKTKSKITVIRRPAAPADDPLKAAIESGNIELPGGPPKEPPPALSVEPPPDLTHLPGEADRQAADKIDQDKPKIPEPPPVQVSTQFLGAIRAVLSMHSQILKDHGSKWALTDAEIDGLVETLPPVLDKYLPKVAAYMPEIALGNVILAIVAQRTDLGKLLPGGLKL